MEPKTYEENFGPLERRWQRLKRHVRRLARRFSGQPRDILVEIRWRLGDEIMAMPIYEGLRAKWPDAHISVLCNHPDVLIDNPAVHRVNVVPKEPDTYICLRSGPKDVFRLEHYARCAHIPVPENRPRLYYTDWRTDTLTTLPKDRPIIALASGASWVHKRWPMPKWCALAERLLSKGYGIVELGQGDEAIGVGLNLVGKTTVREAACLLHAADMLVCCDSGLMHLARAVSTPVLALFGPTRPAILIKDDPGLSVVDCLRECHGCWNDTAGMLEMGECPKGEPCCLENIEVDAVAARVGQIVPLGGPPCGCSS